MHRRKLMIAMGVAGGLLVLLVGMGVFRAKGQSERVIQGGQIGADWRINIAHYQGVTAVLVGPERVLYLEDGRTSTEVARRVYSATFGARGELYIATGIFSLEVRERDGTRRTLLPPASAGGPLLYNRELAKIAYVKPLEPIGNAIGVYDLNSGLDKIVAEEPKRDIHLLAWDGEYLLVKRFLSNTEPARTFDIERLSLDGALTRIPSLSGVMRQTPGSLCPIPSLDGRHLAYPTQDGIWMISVAGKSVRLHPGAKFITWTPTGLKIERKGMTEIIVPGP
jgi:hypothetical protein